MKDKKVTSMILVVAVLAAGVVVLATSGKNNKSSITVSSTPSSTADDANGAVAATAVAINGYSFEPKVIKIKVGDTVTWTNNDAVKHSIVADNTSDSAPNGGRFGKGETYKFTFTKAGTYTYHCTPHPYMKGTVIVE